MRKKVDREIDSSSFRDPSGNVYKRNSAIFRQINETYEKGYKYFISSGLYKKLIDSGLLIPHEEIEKKERDPKGAYKIIKPKVIQFISYPYEWSFSQLKDAALVTLKIQKIALKYDLSLKDASSFNIQFQEGKPIFVDTLSFEKYRKGKPWVAYRQFCEHFLAPLALMGYKDVSANLLFRVYLDGIPLGLASTLLPASTKLKIGLLTHIHLHAKGQAFFANKSLKSTKARVSKTGLFGLIESLESTVEKLTIRSTKSRWSEYDKLGSYSKLAALHKRELVGEFLGKRKQKMVWDLGANVGVFSRLAADKADLVVSFDGDPASVEENYLTVKKEKEKNILPLVTDLTNPSPSLGWAGEERMSLTQRGPADVVLALALIHHLAISNNTPFSLIAHFLGKICRHKLIIEFVPRQDSKVKKMLLGREDIFRDYNQKTFEKEFRKFFRIISSVKLRNSKRILYLMYKK